MYKQRKKKEKERKICKDKKKNTTFKSLIMRQNHPTNVYNFKANSR
jgi:hypothetical protein